MVTLSVQVTDEQFQALRKRARRAQGGALSPSKYFQNYVSKYLEKVEKAENRQEAV